MIETIYIKLAVYGVLLVALLSGIWFVHHSGYEAGKAEITQQWNTQKTVDALAVAKVVSDNAAKLNESETKYEAQKLINDKRLAAQSGRLFVTAPSCAPGNSATVENLPGTDSASGSERPATVTVDFSDIESQVEQLGHDYNILAAKINAIAEENK